MKILEDILRVIEVFCLVLRKYNIRYHCFNESNQSHG